MRQKQRQRKRKIARRTAFHMRMQAAAAGAHVSNSTIGDSTLDVTNNNNNSGNKRQNKRKQKHRRLQIRKIAQFRQQMGKAPDLNSSRRRKKVANNSKTQKNITDSTITAAVEKTTTTTPTTSAYTPSGKYRKFKKFHDNRRCVGLRDRSKLSHTGTSFETLSTSQMVTRKLLRSIRRRQLNRLTSNAQIDRDKLVNKLNFPRSATQLNNNSETETLEEGEIRSDNEVGLQSESSSQAVDTSIDDDCIYIEPKIDEIVIDDDEPTTSHNAHRRKQQSKNILNWLTSTPCAKNTAISSEENSSATSDKRPLFYSDISRMPWFETINSEDTFANYSKIYNSPITEKTSKSGTSSGTPNEIIVLDDTLTPNMTKNTKSRKRKSNEMDDSVIFVSESKKKETADFIPLLSGNALKPVETVRNPFTPKKSKINNPLFTKSEKKQLDAYNTNAYNPSSGTTTPTKKRMVIIDGSNVAFNHSLNKDFSVKGLKICIDYFNKMGHEVKAIVPQYRLHKSTNPAEMETLHKAGKIVFTPCKNLPGKSSTSYDDRFVLQLAAELDAAVVSNDNYRDLIHENPAFKKIIENRVIGFTWCNDIFMVAKDPYGKWGPTLETILNRT